LIGFVIDRKQIEHGFFREVGSNDARSATLAFALTFYRQTNFEDATAERSAGVRFQFENLL